MPVDCSRRRRWWRTVAIALACAATFGALAQQSTSGLRLRVEGAFLVNFIRYADWPAPRFEDGHSPYRVSVVGSEEVASTFASVAVAAGTIGGRRIAVQRVRLDAAMTEGQRKEAIERLRRSHVVFVADGGTDPRLVLAAVAGAPVLTVSDAPGFAAGGGMLGLVRSGRTLAIEANPEAIRGAGVNVSAKVLKLARLWGGP